MSGNLTSGAPQLPNPARFSKPAAPPRNRCDEERPGLAGRRIPASEPSLADSLLWDGRRTQSGAQLCHRARPASAASRRSALYFECLDALKFEHHSRYAPTA
jgi:hypothetical protein